MKRIDSRGYPKSRDENIENQAELRRRSQTGVKLKNVALISCDEPIDEVFKRIYGVAEQLLTFQD